MSQPAGHASPKIWIRDKFRALDRTLTLFSVPEALAVVATFSPFFEELADLSTETTLSAQGYGSLAFKFAISIPAVLALIFAKRNSDHYQGGLRRGALDVSREWGMSTRGLISGMSYLSEVMDGRGPAKREAPGTAGIYQLMVSIRKTVAAVFDDIDENTLTITLGVAKGDGSEMQIVELTPETSERQKGNRYPVPAIAADCHSMVRARRTKKPNYTPDAHLHPDLQDKPYRSILSLPLVTSKGSVVAVLNIDSPVVDAFRKSSRHPEADSSDKAIKVVHHLCQPALKAMALTIDQAQMYKGYRA